MPKPVELFRLAAVRPPTLAGSNHPTIEVQPVRRPEAPDAPVPLVSDPVTGILLDLEVPENDPDFTVPLADVDEMLADADDAVLGQDLVDLVQQRTRRQLREIVESATWSRRRDWVDWYLTSSLAAGADVAMGRFRVANSMLRALRVMTLLELLSGSDEPRVTRRLRFRRGDHQDLPDAAWVRMFLRFAIVQLPVSRVPAPHNVLARAPAIADLKVVRLGPPRYEPGAIAHIENVLATEKRRRTHRLREETEQTTTTETERTEETENDLTTNSTLQMQQMAMETLGSTVDTEAGVKVSAAYGPTVSVELNGNLARHESREAVNQASQSLSNSVTQTARNKIVERTREERISRHLIETEEVNLHSFDNTEGPTNIQGVYRHVNEVQDAWIENYGKRLMLEFIVPEPAAVVRWAAEAEQPGAPEDPEPPKPTVGANNTALSPELVSEENYLPLVGRYGASGVEPPPSPSVDVSATFMSAATQDLYLFSDNSTLTVPDGFKATAWSAQCVTWGAEGADHSWMVGVGQDEAPAENNDGAELRKFLQGSFDREQKSKIPVIMLGRGLFGLAASVNVRCDRTAAKLDEWKLKVFDRVMAAWRSDHQDWEARKARADAQARNDALSAPINGSDNPENNRAVERREIRRNVIAMLLGSPPDQGIFGGNAIVEEAPEPPQVDLDVAAQERDAIQFFEQAFEWPNTTYVHYPYYWADSDEWSENITRSTTDPLWAAFLSAGASRVAVPVRPGFEATVTLFLATGVFWPGGHVPTVGEPAYLGIAEEVAESLGTGNAEPEKIPLDPVVLPTPLVWLQPEGDLNPDPAVVPA